ncbi:LytTR family DNA-binding domain-containing protein [Chryseolinea sp. H1M3-3]|uniref:LytR/AlgR family response regulator transcription factor n=1 Tax=Chryseolinea sp. H1M3-3 TaxID=3034144 RepID=UPI0023ECA14C|nr:LytTR family DNA-binding domain-containing protein [Chryseolinea sp. H1M3-3]
MRCIAVDDEKWALDLLVDNIRHVPYLELVARCKNARDASESLHAGKIDLIFTDVQMPGLNGLQFIQTLPEPPMVILVTAYEQYALEGFNLSVVDYLVKPVALERFIKACNKAKLLFDMRTEKSTKAVSIPDHIFINVEYSLVKIIFDDITHVEGLKDYIKIHLSSASKPILTRMSMKAMEEKLSPSKFIRIHKSFIVAVDKVTSIKRDFVCIHETEIPVGESFKESIKLITGNRK